MPATAGSPGRVATLGASLSTTQQALAAESSLCSSAGMFILDAFEYDDLDSVPPGLPTSMQIGGGGTFGALDD